MKVRIVLLVLCVLASCAAGFFFFQWNERRAEVARRESQRLRERVAAEKRQQATDRRLTELARSVEAIERSLDELRGARGATENASPIPAEREEPLLSAEAATAELNAMWDEIAAIKETIPKLREDAAIQFSTEHGTAMQLGGAAAPNAVGTGSNPNAPRWSHEQFLGAPDTLADGDVPTAWASSQPDSGTEWLEADFERALLPDSVLIRETYNPGAIMSVEAADAAGNFHVVWSGTDPTTESPGEFVVPYGLSFATQTVRITLDSARVRGWNEIDAVGLVTGENVSWAVDGEASSTYGENPGR